MKRIFAILILLSIVIFAWNICEAQELKLEASLERTKVSPGNPLYLYLTFFGTQDAPKPDIVQMDGLKIKYVGPATKVSIVNGKVSKSISHTYLIIPEKDGLYELGPYSVQYRGKKYLTEPVFLRVGSVPSSMTSTAKKAAASQAKAAIATSAKQTNATTSPSTYNAPVYKNQATKLNQDDTGYQSDKIFIKMDVDKTTMYVNEKVDVTITLFVNNMEVQDIGFPVYSHEGFTAEEFDKPERTVKYLRGVRYEVLIFRQTLFGVKEGKFNIGPAKIQCKILSSSGVSGRSSFFGMNNFFSRRFGANKYPIELISNDVPVHVLPFPKQGRPSGFKGAVGDFSLEVYPQTNEVKVGDPVVLKSIIKGFGNLATVTAPVISDLNDFKTYDPQVNIKGVSKIYEQILIPTKVEVKEIPKVSFSYFDPRIRKYITLEKGPFPLAVKKRPDGEKQIKMISADTGTPNVYMPQEELGEDIIHIKTRMGRLSEINSYIYESRVFWLFQILAVIFLIFLCAGHKRRERVLNDEGYARFLKAPRKARKGLDQAKSFIDKNDPNAFYDVLFKTFQDYLGDKFNLPKGNINYPVVEGKLKAMQCEQSIIKKSKNVFEKCEIIRYSSLTTDGGNEDLLKTVREIIDYLEKKRI